MNQPVLWNPQRFWTLVKWSVTTKPTKVLFHTGWWMTGTLESRFFHLIRQLQPILDVMTCFVPCKLVFVGFFMGFITMIFFPTTELSSQIEENLRGKNLSQLQIPWVPPNELWRSVWTASRCIFSSFLCWDAWKNPGWWSPFLRKSCGVFLGWLFWWGV